VRSAQHAGDVGRAQVRSRFGQSVAGHPPGRDAAPGQRGRGRGPPGHGRTFSWPPTRRGILERLAGGRATIGELAACSFQGKWRDMTDFSDMAKGIIESNRYMVLGTADEAGVPWVTPVWYAQSDYRRFLWVSSPDRRHSRNVRARPEVSIVIFDSRVEVGSARGVHVGARRASVERRPRTRHRFLRHGDPRSGPDPPLGVGGCGRSGALSAVSGDGVAALGPRPRQQSRRPRRGHAAPRLISSRAASPIG
jgi:hypothetical protein